MLQLIGFDGDDTLWHSEGYYQQAQAEFAAIVGRHVDLADQRLHDSMLATERRNLKLFGYGAKGMTLSMVETAIVITDGRITAAEIHQLVWTWCAVIITTTTPPRMAPRGIITRTTPARIVTEIAITSAFHDGVATNGARTSSIKPVASEPPHAPKSATAASRPTAAVSSVLRATTPRARASSRRRFDGACVRSSDMVPRGLRNY